MRRTVLCAALALSVFLILPNKSDAQVYFAGWVNSSSDIDDYQDAPSQSIDREPRYKPKKVTHRQYSSFDAPANISSNGEKVIIIDPRAHTWGAYAANGKLVRSGLATAGARWCDDIGRGCKTRSGTFRIYSLGSYECISSKYPIDEGGGAPMPYCMYFNGSQGLHGSDHVVAGNISHGCVRLRVSDAEWIRFNFARVGTKVVVKPY